MIGGHAEEGNSKDSHNTRVGAVNCALGPAFTAKASPNPHGASKEEHAGKENSDESGSSSKPGIVKDVRFDSKKCREGKDRAGNSLGCSVASKKHFIRHVAALDHAFLEEGQNDMAAAENKGTCPINSGEWTTIAHRGKKE